MRHALYGCGHDGFYSRPVPAIGDTLLCRMCGATTRIVKIVPEIRVKCDDCTYSRGFGQADMTARVFASKHAIKRRHRVFVTRGRETLSTHGTSGEQTELLPEDPNDPAPF